MLKKSDAKEGSTACLRLPLAGIRIAGKETP